MVPLNASDVFNIAKIIVYLPGIQMCEILEAAKIPFASMTDNGWEEKLPFAKIIIGICLIFILFSLIRKCTYDIIRFFIILCLQ